MASKTVRHLRRAMPIFGYIVLVLCSCLFIQLVLGLEPKHDGRMGLLSALLGLVGVTLGIYQRDIVSYWRRPRRHREEDVDDA